MKIDVVGQTAVQSVEKSLLHCCDEVDVVCTSEHVCDMWLLLSEHVSLTRYLTTNDICRQR